MNDNNKEQQGQLEPALPARFPALVPGLLYWFANKSSVLYLHRKTSDKKNEYMKIYATSNRTPLLLVDVKIEDGTRGIWYSDKRAVIIRNYFFLIDGVMWSMMIHQEDDTISEWLKPLSCFARFNPEKRNKKRNMGTQYPGRKNENA